MILGPACPPDVRGEVALARTTETLPVLMLTDEKPTDQRELQLCASVVEAFLVVRASLRRERPAALRGSRTYGALTLDEPGFRLNYIETSIALSRAEVAVLGPFFDVPGAVFDREILARLFIQGQPWNGNTRLVDVQISRVRRRVKQELGFGLLKSVRGQGYVLVSEPA